MDRAAAFLAGLGLRLHATENVTFPVRKGIPVPGRPVFPTHRLPAKAHVRRFRRRLRAMQKRCARYVASYADLMPRLQSWIGHASQADTRLLRERPFGERAFRQATAE